MHRAYERWSKRYRVAEITAGSFVEPGSIDAPPPFTLEESSSCLGLLVPLNDIFHYSSCSSDLVAMIFARV